MDRKAWIVITLCIVGMVINGWWMATRPPAPPPPPPPPSATPATTPDKTAATPAIGTTPAATVTPGVATRPEEKVELKNEVAAYTFTTKGGGIAEAVLLDTKDHVRLNSHGKAAIGSLTGAAKTYEDTLPYRIVEKTDQKIVFEAEGPDQVLVRKTYAFSTGEGSNGHLLDFQVTITNRSGAKLSKDSYFLYAGAANELRPDEISKPAFCWNDAGDAEAKHTDAFRPGAGFMGFGGPILDYHANFNRVRWAGVMSRFYATLIANKEDKPTRAWAEPFFVDHRNDEFKEHAKAAEDKGIHGGFSLPAVELETGASKTHDMQIYLGPKIYHDLKKIDMAEGRVDRQLREVMFYGKWFGWVSRGLAWALRVFHDLTGNWGMAIILLTIAVRSLLWPLQARSNAQMKKMGKLSPMLKELQEKYKDDQQRFAQEQMKMFREYGVNPLGGCLPLLIQFPIFIAFYTVLQVATELRGQPFVWWVTDLSLPDTIASFPLGFNLWPIGTHIDLNPLPLLMGVTMFLQMKLTPQPSTVDPMQRRIFMLMPFMFLAFCYTFASALALYWTFTNIFMIVQAQITRALNKGADDAPLQKVNPGGGSPGGGAAPSNPMLPGQKKKKDRPHQPRPGGGGVKPTKPKNP